MPLPAAVPPERPETLIIYAALAGATVMTVIAPWSARLPGDLADIMKFAGVGLIGGAAQYFVIRALHRAPASVVSPIGYAELVSAAAFGYAVFGDFPDGLPGSARCSSCSAHRRLGAGRGAW